MKKNFLLAAKTTLVLIYLVIIAGALVRMTGSGMGCPDWPKCFGYYIPPTDIQELTWMPGRVFESGQVIIKDEKLLVATSDFTTGAEFDASKWRPYTKHDYAIFNPTHTWIEYLNRLAGALAGLSTLIMAIMSMRFWRENKKLTLLSWLAVFLMGFQGWLGATVVYSVLNPLKITMHMVVALLIVALVVYIIRKAGLANHIFIKDRTFRIMLVVALVLTLLQIIVGTQVRQYVDEQVKVLGYNQMQLVLENPDFDFYLHRSFSILIFVVNFYLFYKSRKMNYGLGRLEWIMALTMLEVLTGVAMYYFAFPFGTQALHLIIASIIFGLQFYNILSGFAVKEVKKPS